MQLALEEFYMKGDPTKLGVVLNVIDVEIEQKTPNKSENTTDVGTDVEFNSAVGNVSYREEFVDNYSNASLIQIESEDTTSKSNDKFDFNSCILEVCEIIKSLSQVDKTKYVKVFEKDGEASVGIQHNKVKALARRKSAKLSPIPHSMKNFPKEVRSGCKTFTKSDSASSVGASNTTSGYCLLIHTTDLSSEARQKVWAVLELYCSVCEYESSSGIDLQSHVKEKHIQNEIQCNVCGKQVNEDHLAKHNEEHRTNLNNEEIKHKKNKRKSSSMQSKKSNCYLVFLEERRPILKLNYPKLTSIQLTQKISEEWQNLSKAEKHVYRLRSDRLNKYDPGEQARRYTSCPACEKHFSNQADVIKHLVLEHIEHDILKFKPESLSRLYTPEHLRDNSREETGTT